MVECSTCRKILVEDTQHHVIAWPDCMCSIPYADKFGKSVHCVTCSEKLMLLHEAEQNKIQDAIDIDEKLPDSVKRPISQRFGIVR